MILGKISLKCSGGKHVFFTLFYRCFVALPLVKHHRYTDFCDCITISIPQIEIVRNLWNRAYAAGDKNL